MKDQKKIDPINDNNLKHIKLSCGDDLFGYVLPTKEDGIDVLKPMHIIDVSDEMHTGSILSRFMPFCNDEDNKIFLSSFHILAITSISEEVINFYKLSSHLCDSQQEQYFKNLSSSNDKLSKAISLDMNQDNLINSPYSTSYQ